MSNEVIIVNSNGTQIAGPATVSDYIDRWNAYNMDKSPRTMATYEKNIKRFAEWMIENQIVNPQREDIIEYRNFLNDKGYKATTVWAYLQAVKMFFQWLADEGLYKNVAKSVRNVKIDKEHHKKDYLTARNVRKVTTAIDRSTIQGARDYAIISLMVTTGLRTVSVADANIEDVRTVGDCLRLYYLGKGRTEKSVYVKIGPKTEDAIRDYLNMRGSKKATDPLFTSVANRDFGKRLTTRSISRICKEAMKAAGFDSERLTAHSLRHTAATINLQNGATPKETQQMLDHVDLNTTMIYSHELDREKNNSEYRIEHAIFG